MEPPVLKAEGSVLLFDGPVSNLQATEALFAEAEKLGIPPGNMICTGDTVAYCGSPQETVTLLRRAGVTVIQGNCEATIGEDSDDCGCGYDENSVCDLLSKQWHSFARNKLDRETKEWMQTLPTYAVLEVGDRRLAIVHGGVTALHAFYRSSSTVDKFSEIKSANVDGVVAGHAAIPFVQLIEDKLWLSPGAVGMPANDGTPRTWYAVLYDQADGLEVEIRALHYDHSLASQVMRQNGLSNAYAGALESGLWPGMDGLPESERQQRNVPLMESKAFWPSALSQRSKDTSDSASTLPQPNG